MSEGTLTFEARIYKEQDGREIRCDVVVRIMRVAQGCTITITEAGRKANGATCKRADRRDQPSTPAYQPTTRSPARAIPRKVLSAGATAK